MSLYLVLLRMGFAQPTGHPAAGELLPHHFTLTFTPKIKIFGEKAVCFCGTFRRVTPPGRYPASCPVELGLSSRLKAGGHPVYLTYYSVVWGVFLVNLKPDWPVYPLLCFAGGGYE